MPRVGRSRVFAVLRAVLLGGALGALSGCAGPSLHPVTTPVPAGTEVRVSAPSAMLEITGTGADSVGAPPCLARDVYGRATRQAGDTIWLDPLRQVDAYLPASPVACVRHRTARVVMPRDSVTVERVQEAGIVTQAVATVVMAAAVGATILLLYSAADGLIDAIDRWF